MTDRCPHCDASLQGDAIPQEYIDAGYYGTATHWRREIGYEIQGVYDGVLFWVCPDCVKAWPRWVLDGRLADESARYVELHNNAAVAGA